MQSTGAHTTFFFKGVLCAVLLLGSLAHLVLQQNCGCHEKLTSHMKPCTCHAKSCQHKRPKNDDCLTKRTHRGLQKSLQNHPILCVPRNMYFFSASDFEQPLRRTCVPKKKLKRERTSGRELPVASFCAKIAKNGNSWNNFAERADKLSRRHIALPQPNPCFSMTVIAPSVTTIWDIWGKMTPSLIVNHIDSLRGRIHVLLLI